MDLRPPPTLTPLEARVVAVLHEKRRTVPDTYPLTLNALVAGCNQKTSRDPVMDATAAEVQQALETLRRKSLVIETSGGRAMRYAENLKAVLQVPSESVALLAVLMLRGPQTAAELRSHCERMQRFSDQSALEGFLHELAEWSAGAMVVELPRRPGERECRWAHLLCGPVAAVEAASRAVSVDAGGAWQAPAAESTPVEPATQASPAVAGRLEELERRLASLADEVDALRERIAHLEAGSGPAAPRDPQ